nr:hypothetical protein BaRGS_027204 [Batillaria attramentaria]
MGRKPEYPERTRTEDQLHDVKITHKPPEGLVDKMAFMTVKMLRGGFDIFSGFKVGDRNEKKWEDATMRDVVLAIRADEAHHRVVNHTLASMKPDDFNPYKPGQ